MENDCYQYAEGSGKFLECQMQQQEVETQTKVSGTLFVGLLLFVCFCVIVGAVVRAVKTYQAEKRWQKWLDGEEEGK